MPSPGSTVTRRRYRANPPWAANRTSCSPHSPFPCWRSSKRPESIELVGDTCWRFYRHWGRATRAVTHLIARNPTQQLRLSVNAFLTYPFGRPGYRFDDVPEADGRSLNMLRCPVVDYLAQRGAADLCAGSWCNLDYALAEMWGARLQRTGTLAGGAVCCDFRFHTRAAHNERPESSAATLIPLVRR
jgi:hypothetical protein